MSRSPRSARVHALLLAALAVPGLAPLAHADGETPLFPALRLATGGETPRAVASADLDRDGDDDLIVGHSTTHVLSVHLGGGDGSFAAPDSYAVQSAVGPKALAVADVDGDANLDVVAGHAFDVSLLMGSGGGAFDAPIVTAFGALVQDIELGDMDGDGLADLSVSRQPVNRVSLHVWDGATFIDGPWQLTGDQPESHELGDVDLDGDLDVVTVNYSSGDLSILLGTGTGNLLPASSHPMDTHGGQLALGDWNGDGALDAAISRGIGFTQLLVADGNGDGSFEPPSGFEFSNDDSSLLSADLDRDGTEDLLVVGAQLTEASVLLGGPKGLVEVGKLQTALYTESAALLDVDGDGALDVAIGNRSLDSVDVIRGRGDGSFEQSILTPAGLNPAQPTLADMDGDGDLDVVVSELTGQFFQPQDVAIYLNDGSGALSVSQKVQGGPYIRDIALGDVNEDGDMDVLFPLEDAAQVGVWFGDGDGTLTQGPTLSVGLDPSQLRLGDIDDDGHLDVVLLHVTPDQLVVHRGAGDGTFGSALPRAIANWGTDFELAHLDSDVYLDAVVTSWGALTDEIRVFHGMADGSFQPVQVFAPPYDNPFDVEVGDFDEDGLPDLALYMAYEEIFVAQGLVGGTFGALVSQGEIATTTVPLVEDIDGDGHLDWLAAGTTGMGLTLRRGDGSLTLLPEQRFGIGTPLGDPVVGDMNGDGLLDVVTAGYYYDDAIYVTLQQREDAWVGLDERLSGSTPWPSLMGTGSLEGGELFTISIAGLPPNSLAHLKLGFFTWNLPFKGGTMVPDLTPPGLSLSLITDPVGGIAFSLPFPVGAPSGFQTFWQTWFPDPGAIAGWGSSNAVVGTTP